MNIFTLSDFITGYCEFELDGFLGERLLNAAMSENIDVWDIRKTSQTKIHFKTFLFSRQRIIELCDEINSYPKVDIKENYRKGLLPFLYNHRNRSGIIVGFALFCIIFFLMSSLIWEVRLVDCDGFDPEEILGVLRENGLFVGAFSSAQDGDVLALRLMNEMNAGYATVNIEGSVASVTVSYGESPPETVPVNTPCNVFASRDGVIISVKAYQGDRLVEKNQAVCKGQLLVSGVFNSKRQSYRLVHADADVEAYTRRESSVFCPYESETVTETGNKATKYYIKIFSLKIKLPFIGNNNFEKYETETESIQLTLGENNLLPVFFIGETLSEQKSTAVFYTESEAEEYIRACESELSRVTLNGINVISVTESFEYSSEGVRGIYEYYCIENIASQREIYRIKKD